MNFTFLIALSTITNTLCSVNFHPFLAFSGAVKHNPFPLVYWAEICAFPKYPTACAISPWPREGMLQPNASLMGFSQSHPQYLPTSAFTGVRNQGCRCSQVSIQWAAASRSDNQLLISSWGNSTMSKSNKVRLFSQTSQLWEGALLLPSTRGLQLLVRLRLSLYSFGRKALQNARRCAPLQHGAEHAMVCWHLLHETRFDRNLEKVVFGLRGGDQLWQRPARLNVISEPPGTKWQHAVHFFPKFKRVDVNTGRKRPACLELVGVVILSSKVTFPVSMNYSYILVRDTVWGIYGAFNSAIIDLLD